MGVGTLITIWIQMLGQSGSLCWSKVDGRRRMTDMSARLLVGAAIIRIQPLRSPVGNIAITLFRINNPHPYN